MTSGTNKDSAEAASEERHETPSASPSRADVAEGANIAASEAGEKAMEQVDRRSDTALVKKRVTEWASKLIDLSRRNRLLFYRPTKRTTLTFHLPSPKDLLGRALSGSPFEFWVPDEPELGEAPPSLESALEYQRLSPRQAVATQYVRKELLASLEALMRRGRAEFEDRGTHVLHIAWGLLRYPDPRTQEEGRAPIILVPVTLSRRSVNHPYVLQRADEDAVINPALRVKMEVDLKITMPDIDVENTPLDDVLVSLRRSLPDGWAFEDHAVLGLFSFAKEPMYRDLMAHLSDVAAHPIVRSLALGRIEGELARQLAVELPADTEMDAIQTVENTYSILDADSSQRRSIEAAIRGMSFVMQGPPGTGKSQTIANVIAEYIGRGQTVLFVSEKMAALEVVAERLQSAGIRDLVLELHSHKASRREVARDIGSLLDEELTFEADHSRRDGPRLEADERALNGYVDGIHAVRQPLGRTVFSVLADIAALADVPALEAPPIDHQTVTPAALDHIERVFSALEAAWQPVTDGADFVWRGSALAAFQPTDRQRVSDILDRVRQAMERLDGALTDVLEPIGLRSYRASKDARARLRALPQLVSSRPDAPPHWLSATSLESIPALLEEAVDHAAKHHRATLQLSADYGPEWRRLDGGLLQDLTDTSLALASRLGIADLDERDVKPRATSLADAARRADHHLAAAAEVGTRLGELLGVKAETNSLDNLRLVLKVARLSQERNRPVPQWFSRARLEEAAHFVATHGPAYRWQQSAYADLASRFDVKLLDLDLPPLLERMRRHHGRLLSALRPTYRRDRRGIVELSRTRSLSTGVVAELEAALTLKSERLRLQGLEREERDRLGDLALGLDTDIGAAEQGIAAAREYLSLPPETDWTRLQAVAAHGTAFSPEVERLADRLEAELQTVGSALDVLVSGLGSERVEAMSTIPNQALSRSLTDLAEAVDGFLSVIQRYESGRLSPAPTVAQSRRDLEARRAVDEAELWFQETDDALADALQSSHDGPRHAWEAQRRAVEWAQLIRAYYSGPVPQQSVAPLLASPALPWTELWDAEAGHEAAVLDLGAMFDDEHRPALTAHLSNSIDEAATRLAALHERMDDLSVWVSHKRALQEATSVGWQGVAASLAVRAVPAEQVTRTARRAWLESWLLSVSRSTPDIDTFQRVAHEHLVEDFRRRDLALIEDGPDRVLAAYSARKPRTYGIVGGEPAILRREAVKQRRHLPVRELLAKIPNLLPKLKPCLMMSPLSVSHFLTAGMTFDLVVFDEASQVTPEDAINCVYRGRQLIVTGDRNQLPPTDFFRTLTTDDDEDSQTGEQTEDFQSVLDLCEGSGLPALPLRWHYRSHHEGLIAFSNEYIYGGGLVTFPSPRRGDPVEFVYVADGLFERGGTARNVPEARRVVDVAVEQLSKYPSLTLGVVAFSLQQADAIRDELQRRYRRDPTLEQRLTGDRLRGFFIKNLETVQGDERDVIIFSIGYGRDADGRFLMNFGPLTRPGGARRLNVAITRARQKVIVVSSVTAQDFRGQSAVQAAGAMTPGAELLRAYLDYAQRGTSALATVPGARVPEPTPFEAAIADTVRELGYEPIAQVGTSEYRVDVAVASADRPGEFLIGIEGDGHFYQHARVARDRDRLRAQVLHRLGWRTHRAWSQAWATDGAIERTRLASAISDALRDAQRLAEEQASEAEAPLTETPSDRHYEAPIRLEQQVDGAHPTDADLPPTPRAERRRVRTADVVAIPPWAMYYKRVQLSSYKRWYEFHDDRALREHAERIDELIKGEGPAHRDYVAIRLAQQYGLNRVGNRISSAVDTAIRRGETAGRVRVRGPFIWPPLSGSLRLVRIPDPTDPETLRGVEEIPPEEIDLAMLRVTEMSMSLAEEELRTQTARLFGFARTGERIWEVLSFRIDALKRDRRLVVADDGLLRLEASLPIVSRKGAAARLRLIPGTLVRHPRYGVGRVVRVDGDNVTIAYADIEREVDAALVHLERIG